MTAEEMEVAYCKARRTCMKSFRMWLREHIKIVEEASSLGLNNEQVQKLTIAAMKKAEEEISKELDGVPELISESAQKPADECGKVDRAAIDAAVEKAFLDPSR